jgi:hypothetical protein
MVLAVLAVLEAAAEVAVPPLTHQAAMASHVSVSIIKD